MERFWLDENGLKVLGGSDGEQVLLSDWSWRFQLDPPPGSSAEEIEREFVTRDLLGASTSVEAFENWAKNCASPSVEVAAACHEIGELFFISGRRKEALRVLTWGLALDAEQPDLLADQIVWSSEENTNTIQQTVAKLEKRSIIAADRVAIYLQQRKLNAQAVMVFARLTAIAPHSATLWAKLAVAYASDGEPKRSKQCLDYALALDPLSEAAQRASEECARGFQRYRVPSSSVPSSH